MKTWGKILAAAAIAALVGLPTESAQAYWWGPGYAPGWSQAYLYDPNYWMAPPRFRPYIRDLHKYGPAYAAWRHRHLWHTWW